MPASRLNKLQVKRLNQTSAPNTAPATSVSPLGQSGSSKTKLSKNKSYIKTDVYQMVKDCIIEVLEMGVKPWVRNGAAAGLPANFSTGTAYSGINIMLLWSNAAKQGFQDSRWLTYKQAQELGGQVRKGKSDTTAIFYKMPRRSRRRNLTRCRMLKPCSPEPARTLQRAA